MLHENICLAVTRDITDHKIAMDQIQESEERYHILVDNAPDAIVVWEPADGQFVEINHRALELFGLTKQNFPCYGPLRLSSANQSGNSDPQAAFLHYEEKAAAGHSPVFEWTFVNTRGEDILCEVRLVKVPLKDRNLIQGIVEDIREKKQIEEEMFKIRKLESVGLLAGGIAHDFNNLLTAILGNISLTKLLCEAQPDVQVLLNDAESASFRAKELTAQLLTFSKGGAPIRKAASLKDLVIETTAFALRGSAVCCEFEFDEDLWLVDVDKDQISQVIHNLVINADQSMPDGGRIFISGKNWLNHDGDNTAKEKLRAGRYVLLRIQDQGMGSRRIIYPKFLILIFPLRKKAAGWD